MIYQKRYANKQRLAPGSLSRLLQLVLWLILCCFAGTSFTKKEKEKKLKPRLIVMTDITSVTAGFKEPDDGESMVRLMLYSNDFDIEGLLATSNLQHAQATKPELIRQVVEAYRKDRSSLIRHDPNYPSADYLLSVIKSGNPIAGKTTPILPNIGEGKDTEASDWIVKVADKPDQRPVWISIWGGSTDLAQALWKVRATRNAAALKKFISRLRIRSIGDQDGGGVWIRSEFPDLYFVLQSMNLRGMYRGGDTTLTSSEWVQTNIRKHGALGELYPEYNGGDIWSGKIGGVKGIKEGDTPSFLALMVNGFNESFNPEWLSWGGFSKPDSVASNFVDAIDSIGTYRTDLHPAMASVYRWRPAFQADFAARLDWCTKSYSEANHAPVANVRVTKSKDGWNLDASASKDPDNDKLEFVWFQDKSASTCKEIVVKERATGNVIKVPFIKGQGKQTVHIILEVHDNGTPGLRNYKRVILE